MTAWHQWQITTTNDRLGEIEDDLLILGCDSITLSDAKDQAIYEPLPQQMPTWDHVVICALFNASIDNSMLRAQIENLLLIDEHADYSLLPNKDWQREWLDNYKPLEFANNLWIVPSHMQAPNPDATNIILDAGLAFGSGTHPTTALCLNWLGTNSMRQKTVFDFGSGSGILAIAAAKLGASKVYATDIDPQAMKATKKNAFANNVFYPQLNMLQSRQLPTENIDLIIANILSKPLLELSPVFSSILKSGSTLVLCGILEYQAKKIIDHYSVDFNLEATSHLDEWVLIHTTKK